MNEVAEKPADPPKVKCAECGFLALRDHHSLALVEATEHFRTTGNRPTTPSGQLVYAKGIPPLCFARAIDLPATIGQPPTDDRIKATIDATRLCRNFTPWQQGFSPKEHQEMVNQQIMLDWQREREEADRAWRTAESTRAHRWQIAFLAVALLGIIVGFIGGIVAAMIGRGNF
ncbi:MAG: hypothetical protein DCC68_25330 [Planctomycetota bacterium]|nr:MAG: hypothetical protein DCC68_25330 [Planctomycetota bacterium]